MSNGIIILPSFIEQTIGISAYPPTSILAPLTLAVAEAGAVSLSPHDHTILIIAAVAFVIGIALIIYGALREQGERVKPGQFVERGDPQ